MIMESTTNLQQDQPSPVVDPSSSSASSSLSNSTPSYATIHSWNPNITLNNAGNFNSNLQEATNQRSRSCLIAHKNDMIQDLGYHNQWTSDEFSKEEISFANFPKFTEMLNYTTPNNSTMLKTLLTEQDFYSSQSYNNPNFGGTNHISSSQIHPSINISNLNHYSSSTTLDMNMQSLDLLTTSPTSFTNTSQSHFGKFTHHDNNLSFHLHPMHHSSSSNSSNQSLLSNIGTVETKRGCTLMESKVSQSQTALKKSRSSSESRPSCPPFKVRKEKLGDRIAALQQLVAPFGKTDTASVLMEAIGYIKFLQGQVETLSVPYMKSSQNQNNRVMRGGSTTCDTNGEPKQDLRSRGLCLVPLSCMSYIATDGGTEPWQQHHNFGRPT